MDTYDLPTLRRKSLKELAAIGSELGLRFTKNHTKARRVSLLVAAQAQRAADAGPNPVRRRRPKPVPSPSPVPDFDRLTGGADGPDSSRVPSSLPSPLPVPGADARGGTRPGAGRPVGMTDDRARMTRVGRVSHPPVTRSVKALFELWASAAHCPAVALTDEEAADLSLAPTQAMEYTGIIRYVPAWLEILADGLATWFLTVKYKAALARDAAAQRKARRGENDNGKAEGIEEGQDDSKAPEARESRPGV